VTHDQAANDRPYQEVFVSSHQLSVPMQARLKAWVRANLAWAAYRLGHRLRRRRAKSEAEVNIHVDCANYGVIENLHQAIMNAVAQYLRQSRMSADAISASVF
jgi:hypothetical protein